MKIYDRLLEVALPLSRGKIVQRICIGLGYTAVEISGGQVGLAYTLFESGCCEVLPKEVTFWERPADLVLKGLLSSHPLEVTVALATANALLNNRKQDWLYGDILSIISPGPEDEVALVGYFEPLVRKLMGRVKSLWIFERGERQGPGLLSEAEMPEYLPRADLIFITSVTLINRTLEDILEQIQRAREVVLLGASTPLAPEVFRFTPVTLLSGVRIHHPEALFRLVAEAKGFPAFKKALEKVNLRVLNAT